MFESPLGAPAAKKDATARILLAMDSPNAFLSITSREYTFAIEWQTKVYPKDVMFALRAGAVDISLQGRPGPFTVETLGSGI